MTMLVWQTRLFTNKCIMFQDVYLHSKETVSGVPGGHTGVRSQPRVSFTGPGHLTYIDIGGPLDNDTITAKTLPRTSVRSDNNGKLPSKIFASPENFKLSVRSLSQSSRSMISSSPEFLRKEFQPRVNGSWKLWQLYSFYFSILHPLLLNQDPTGNGILLTLRIIHADIKKGFSLPFLLSKHTFVKKIFTN